VDKQPKSNETYIDDKMILGSVLRSASPPPQDAKKKMTLLPQRGKDPELPKTATGTKQTIQARHGTATFVPKGHTIKVVNTYGKQVVDLWGFALHAPPTKDEWDEDNREVRDEEVSNIEGSEEEDLERVNEADKAESHEEEEMQQNNQEVKLEGKEDLGDEENREVKTTSEEMTSGEGSHVMVERDEVRREEEPRSEEITSGEGSHILVEKDDVELPSNEETEKKIAEAIETATEEEYESTLKPDESGDNINADLDITEEKVSQASVENEKEILEEEKASFDEKKESQNADITQIATSEVTEKNPAELEQGVKEVLQELVTEEKPANSQEKEVPSSTQKPETPSKGWASYIPSVRGLGKQAEKPGADQEQSEATDTTPKSASKGWGSYLPSVRGLRKSTKEKESKEDKEERTWGSYIPSGQGYSNYLPNRSAISSFASLHQRDSSKSVAEQLYDFSKTPVGAAGLSGKVLLFPKLIVTNTFSSRDRIGICKLNICSLFGI
jgi:hypothetical protein